MLTDGLGRIDTRIAEIIIPHGELARLNDPWGDLVNYFRDINVTQIKYRLLAEAVDQLL
jgi:hypothetical protein